MKSRTMRRFRDLLAALPAKVQQQAYAAYALFASHPNHPGLRLKQVHSEPPIFSARVGIGYRAVAFSTVIRSSGIGSAPMRTTIGF